MTTAEVLHQLFFRGRGTEAVRSTVRRLRHAGYLQTGDLTATKRQYLRLSKLGTRVLGIPASFCRPLGEQALIGRYAVLAYCCAAASNRLLLQPDEFEEEFADCVSKGLPNEPYSLEQSDGRTRLAYLLVGYGADAGRVVRKCQRAYVMRQRVDGFCKLLADDAFIVTVLTAEPTKKEAVLAAASRNERLRFRIGVETLTQLQEVY
ncbi:MAG: hypothetical protein AAGJ46_17750 [Planctomycetota bacterium]